jgi:hypothetical protein
MSTEHRTAHQLKRRPNNTSAGRMTTCCLAAAALLLSAPVASAQAPLPPDAVSTCAVPPAEFAQWWFGGAPVKDGIVLPANSLNFAPPPAPNDDCAFFKWSMQMFLWLASPLGPGKHVFASPQFFGVSPLAGDKRKFIPQDSNTLVSFAPAISLVGEKGKEVVADSTGQVRTVVQAQSGPDSPLFRDIAGAP